jgi:hypothetical protein
MPRWDTQSVTNGRIAQSRIETIQKGTAQKETKKKRMAKKKEWAEVGRKMRKVKDGFKASSGNQQTSKEENGS